MEIESDEDTGRIFEEIMHHDETASLQNDKSIFSSGFQRKNTLRRLNN
jgi:hypothetical protein